MRCCLWDKRDVEMTTPGENTVLFPGLRREDQSPALFFSKRAGADIEWQFRVIEMWNRQMLESIVNEESALESIVLTFLDGPSSSPGSSRSGWHSAAGVSHLTDEATVGQLLLGAGWTRGELQVLRQNLSALPNIERFLSAAIRIAGPDLDSIAAELRAIATRGSTPATVDPDRSLVEGDPEIEGPDQ